MPSTSSSSSRARKTNRGRWTRQEHERFLRGLQSVGENWSRVAEFVPTRTELQVRTHAQKYLAKMQQGLPFPQEPYQSGDGDEDESDTEDADDADADNSNVSGGAYGYGYGGGDGGGAAAPIAGHNLDRRWLPIGGQGAGFAVQQQQHYQQQQEHQEQQHQYQQQLPAAGWGQGVPDGRFSPPLGDAAPFTNWPVAGGDLEEELLQFANMDFSSSDIVINNNGNDGDGGGDAATAYFMGQRNSPNHPFSSVL